MTRRQQIRRIQILGGSLAALTLPTLMLYDHFRGTLTGRLVVVTWTGILLALLVYTVLQMLETRRKQTR